MRLRGAGLDADLKCRAVPRVPLEPFVMLLNHWRRMDTSKMSAALRNLGNSIDLVIGDMDQDSPEYPELRDSAELVRVLARVVEGQPILRAFGSPGDWGYGTPIGDALAGPGRPVNPHRSGGSHRVGA